MVFGETMCPGLVLSPQGFDCGWNIGGVINILINVFIVCLVTQSCLTLSSTMYCSTPGSSIHGDSPGKSAGVDCHALLQGIFSTQGSNPDLPHCRQILYHLGHRGRPRTLEWVAYPFSRGSSRLRNRTRISCIARGFFTSWATRQAKLEHRFRNHAVKV